MLTVQVQLHHLISHSQGLKEADMNKMFKKWLSVLLAFIMATLCLSAVVAFGSDSVAINETNFPDANFREFVKDYDLDGNGSLSAEERNIVTIMTVSDDYEIKTLKGIEYFSNIKILRCSNIKLEELNVSALKDLTTLTCMGNELKELNLVENNKLKTLNCTGNELTSITLSSPALTTLDCRGNSLAKLDVTHETALETLYCANNQLSSLNLSQNINLTKLNCTINHITSLDLSKNTKLANVTNAMIGDQTVDLKATFENSLIYVPFKNSGLDSSNYVTSSLEQYGDGSGFNFESFYAFDVSEIDNGITYECNTKLDSSENMIVKVNVTRDFYQVGFYADSDYSSLIGRTFAYSGNKAPNPPAITPPQCKAFDTWNESVENITSDKKVYANWKDAHTYELASFANGTATVKCSVCGDSFTLSFIDAVNSKKGDSNYSPYLDVCSDGVINAKDYSILNKMK